MRRGMWDSQYLVVFIVVLAVLLLSLVIIATVSGRLSGISLPW